MVVATSVDNGLTVRNGTKRWLCAAMIVSESTTQPTSTQLASILIGVDGALVGVGIIGDETEAVEMLAEERSSAILTDF